MTFEKKLQTVKSMLDVPIDDVSLDNEISTYLEIAKEEILNWMYQNHPDKRNTIDEVPLRYEIVQISAVVSGYSQKGAEGEKVHNENGINRTFTYSDMVAYIRSNVFQII